MQKQHIALIGMSGVGKTTLGKEVAKRFNLVFADTDEWMEGAVGNRQKFLNQEGEAEYLLREHGVVLSLLTHLEALYVPQAIIATAGSVIYPVEHANSCAIELFKEKFCIVYLFDTENRIAARRAPTADQNGIIGLKKAGSLEQLARERDTEYRKHADHVVDLSRIADSQAKDIQKTASWVITDLIHRGLLQPHT